MKATIGPLVLRQVGKNKVLDALVEVVGTGLFVCGESLMFEFVHFQVIMFMLQIPGNGSDEYLAIELAADVADQQ